jgi:hypothetical protein
MPAARGTLTVIKNSIPRGELLLRQGRLQFGELGHYQPSRRHLRQSIHNKNVASFQQRWLARLRQVDARIPRLYYQAVLGHDVHLSMAARLYVRHHHTSERDPYTGEDGWIEDVGLVSQGLVTTAFRDFLALMLVTDATTIGDFKFHRPGTAATAEANTQTALTTDAGLEATGTQTNPTASTYQSVATVTADTTGAAGGTMLDRSLISPTVAVVNLDTVQFTYVLTINAE